DAEPDPEIERFAARLRDSPKAMAAAVASEPRHNLPTPPTPLVGREEELRRMRELVADPEVRLVTLTGPGGVGKTRVAIDAGREAVERFPDGVFFVVLGPLRDSELVGTTIARTLGLEARGPRPVEDALVEALRERRCLLVLDSFEGVLSAADLLAELLRETESPKAIVTSRSVLRLLGEHVLPVPPLRAPSDPRRLTPDQTRAYEAVDLFVQRARAARPDFELTEGNHVAVGEVCAHLDGLPLAIELAAARTRLLSPGMIRDRLSNRFELLTGGPRDLPERHQKLRATFDWSYDLLSERERRLFRRVSVFVGGCSLAAVREVCEPEGEEGEILDELAGLVDASLLSRVESVDDEPRFEMLESIREYAWEILVGEGEADDLRRRHAVYYLDQAERLEPRLTGRDQELWLDRLAPEHHNMQAVLDWALERGDFELAVRLGSALWWFWWVRGHFTGMRRRLDRALAERSRLSPSLQTNLLVASGAIASMDGDHERALAEFQEAFAVGRGTVGRREVVRALRSMAFALSRRGEFERAVELLEESHGLARELDSPSDLSAALRGLAKMRFNQRRYEDAERLYREALEIDRGRGDRQSTAWSLAGLGEVARHREDLDEAARLLEEGLALCRELDSKPGIAYLLLSSGHVARSRGVVDEAEARYREALPLLGELGNRRRIGVCLLGLAAVAMRKGEIHRALLLFGAVEPMREPMGIQIAPVDEEEFQKAELRVRETLSEEEIQELRRRGREMDLEEAIAVGLQAAPGQ
ncbi:MAG: tetratricopeptide repeat protein, partial [Gemmatimonadetes bacterium]|nr:tetratricopeptide repeat protein [Gemmatimonadota bacterium]